MNISSHRPSKVSQVVVTTSAMLPVEICTLVLQFADLSADELVRCARSLSKMPNPLSEAAKSLPVWRSWHPQAVTNKYFEVCEHQPDYLVTTFLDRHRTYPAQVRRDLQYYRNHLWRKPTVNVFNFFDMSGQGSGFNFQYLHLAECVAIDKSRPQQRIGFASTPQAFDTAMALLRYQPDSELAYDHVLPTSLCAEPEFLRQGLLVRPAWLSQSALPYKHDPEIKKIAFEAVLQNLKSGKLRNQSYDFPDIPAEFFSDVSMMRAAISYDGRLFFRASETVRLDPEFKRALEGEEAVP